MTNPVCVFAPAPILTVTVESPAGNGVGELHLHPGGQGVWIARLASELGARVTICASFGGETGAVVRSLLTDAPIDVRAVETVGSNGSYVHDRRSGERRVVAELSGTPLSRHETDELYGVTLTAALDSRVVVLGGPSDPDVIDADVYRRLCADLGGEGRRVIADLSGAPLDAVIDGGASVVKVSHEDLLADGRVDDETEPTLVRYAEALVAKGVDLVLITLGGNGAIAISTGCRLRASPPVLETVDPRGSGDSLTAGLAVALARGDSLEAALRTGTAAGAMNATRHGLGTASKAQVERLMELVEITKL